MQAPLNYAWNHSRWTTLSKLAPISGKIVTVQSTGSVPPLSLLLLTSTCCEYFLILLPVKFFLPECSVFSTAQKQY